MRLIEIVILKDPIQSPNIIPGSFNEDDSRIIGNIGEYNILLYSAHNNNKATKKISLVDNNVEIGFMIGIFFKHPKGQTFFKTERIWMNPVHRDKGLMSKLRQFIKSKWHICFMSDRDLTNAGLGMWRKMKSDWNVTIFDAITGEHIPWNISTEHDIFVPGEDFERVKTDIHNPITIKGNRYYLVSESQVLIEQDIFGIPSSNTIIR